MIENARKFRKLLVTLTFVWTTVSSEVIYNPYFHFPGGSEGFMGLLVTLATPIEAGTPGDVEFAVITEASYVLPTNETEFEYPPIISSNGESSERQIFYRLLEGKLEGFGYAGKNCLLRMICEAAEYSTKDTGVLGDLIHIFLTPSTSKKEANMEAYDKAEELGRKRLCKKYYKVCKTSILGAVSKIGSFLGSAINNFD